eukprot:2601623-Pyramimonas_sp.AAC.1
MPCRHSQASLRDESRACSCAADRDLVQPGPAGNASHRAGEPRAAQGGGTQPWRPQVVCVRHARGDAAAALPGLDHQVGGQSQEVRGYIPIERTNHMRVGSPSKKLFYYPYY